MVKVSICIPTYNNAQEVKHLLDSVYVQDYKDIEINVSDDSTNTEIEELVKYYQEQFAGEQIEFHYIHNQKPLGHVFNWNAAIEMAAGEYIKIMFSDDWFTDTHSLSSFVRMLEENPAADIAFSGSRQVFLADVNSKKMKRQTDASECKSYDRCASEDFLTRLRENYRYLFLGNQIGAPSAVIYRRTQVIALFDEDSNWASDMFLYFDILSRNPNFVSTKEPLVSIGVHEHQYTESFANKDLRIYNDYRHLYKKYQLQDLRECRKYFLKKFVVKYHMTMREAVRLGNSRGAYIAAHLMEFWESLNCFIRSRVKH